MIKKLAKKVKALEDRIEALENSINNKSPKKDANEKLERIQHNGEVESSWSKSADNKVKMSSSDIRDPKEDVSVQIMKENEDITFEDILMNKSLFLEFLTKLILISSAINVCVIVALYFCDREKFDKIIVNNFKKFIIRCVRALPEVPETYNFQNLQQSAKQFYTIL